jgi:hypothetical protein
MTRADAVAAVANTIAAVIAKRDAATLRGLLAPGFVHRSHNGPAADADAFLRAVEQIPGEIRFVRLEQLTVDLCPSGALVTGIQHAQVALDGDVIDDRRGFVDWFVNHGGEWRIQAAVDLPPAG